MSRKPTYKGGIQAVLDQYEDRRNAFSYAKGETLIPLDADLTAMASQFVDAPAQDPKVCPPFRSSYHRKIFQLREELTDETELVYLNAILIAHLRKREYPAHAPALFQRLWAEHGTHLLDRLNQRWLVSAITTFGDHGVNTIQRASGLALTALFGMMKLYETERLYSGKTPNEPYALTKTQADLPMEMNTYAITSGGLDVNLIARLWQEADQDPVIAPLAHHLLDLLIHDDKTLFRRLKKMREAKTRPAAPAPSKKGIVAPVPEAHRDLSPGALRWGLVSTIKAPLPKIARFAAHHLELGAHALHIYLDDPDPQTTEFLEAHPRIHVTQCDDAYWDGLGKKRKETHQERQLFNATHCFRSVSDQLHWLGHIDVDEFLINSGTLVHALSNVPSDAAFVRIPPAEALAVGAGTPRHFKLTNHQAQVPKAKLQEIYPTFGPHLHYGFLSHTAGKVFARTGIPDSRLGIHALRYKGEGVTNYHKCPGLFLAHFHAETWEQFRAHLDFRREKGSYHHASQRPELGQSELFNILMADNNEDDLRVFFKEVCADGPALRDRLSAHNMLITHDFDFNGAIKRVFGDLP